MIIYNVVIISKTDAVEVRFDDIYTKLQENKIKKYMNMETIKIKKCN